jgi:hypothetical protein
VAAEDSQLRENVICAPTAVLNIQPSGGIRKLDSPDTHMDAQSEE